jgi:hypothetical protein
MTLKMGRDVKRVTVVKTGAGAGQGNRVVYGARSSDEDHSIKRVTIIRRDGAGRVLSREAFSDEPQGKKQSRHLRPSERGVRALVELQTRVAEHYLDRHHRSNEKRRDGWLRDMPRNIFRAIKDSKPKRLLKLYRIDD